MTYTVLDLFCGEGGAARGYADAGFQIVGVDIEPQPRYPFRFREYDAFEYLERFVINADPAWSIGFDAIHASPPCQRYSTLSKRFRTDRLHSFPDLIGPTRDMLRETGLPYVIENIPLAPLEDPVILCGSQFELTSMWPGVGPPGTTSGPEKVGLRRHRGFEANFEIHDAGPHDHSYRAVPVYGYTNNRLFRGEGLRGESFSDLRKEVMEIDWMSHEGLNEAVPPAYTEYVGLFLLHHLNTTRNRKEAA
jgi:DNA (cytosine-5)-methyltransferase 1